jgi:hypothetical protein
MSSGPVQTARFLKTPLWAVPADTDLSQMPITDRSMANERGNA